jgi:hypothetical protein
MPEPWQLLTCSQSMLWWPLQLSSSWQVSEIDSHHVNTYAVWWEEGILVSAPNLIKRRLYQAQDPDWPSSHSCYLILRTLTNYHTLPPDIYSHMTITASRHITLKITAETFAEIFSYWFRQTINTAHKCQNCIMRYKLLIYGYTQSVQ